MAPVACEEVIFGESGLMVDSVGTALEDLVDVNTERGRGRALGELSVLRETRSGRWRRASTTALEVAMLAGSRRLAREVLAWRLEGEISG